MKKLFKGGHIFDGTGKLPYLSDILTKNGLIIDIGEGIVCDDALKVDCSGKFLMPGLIDCHIHMCMKGSANADLWMSNMSRAEHVLHMVDNLYSHLKSGTTYIRDMGATNYDDIGLKKALKAGMFTGANFICSGSVICITGGHGHTFGREADGVDECRKATREQIKAGADVIKFMATGGVLTGGVQPGSPQLTAEEMNVIVSEAKRADRMTATHAQGSLGIMDAIKAGVDSIEHGIFLNDEIIDEMLERGTWLVPTLIAPLAIIEAGVEAGIPAFAVEKSKMVYKPHLASFKKAYDAGVKIAMGTDAGTPFNFHGTSGREILLMIEAGMSPMDALCSATDKAAQLLRVDSERGTLTKGKVADILVLGENPLLSPEVLLNKKDVYQNGELVK